MSAAAGTPIEMMPAILKPAISIQAQRQGGKRVMWRIVLGQASTRLV